VSLTRKEGELGENRELRSLRKENTARSYQSRERRGERSELPKGGNETLKRKKPAREARIRTRWRQILALPFKKRKGSKKKNRSNAAGKEKRLSLKKKHLVGNLRGRGGRRFERGVRWGKKEKDSPKLRLDANHVGPLQGKKKNVRRRKKKGKADNVIRGLDSPNKEERELSILKKPSPLRDKEKGTRCVQGWNESRFSGSQETLPVCSAFRRSEGSEGRT